MAKPSLKLWKALQELKADDFKKFKWFLKQDDVSAAQLEKADRQDTVDLMAQKYGDTGAMREAMTILEKISRNDLVQGLETCPEPTDLRDDSERKKSELKDLQRFSLDPNLSRSGERVLCGDTRRKLVTDPERFYRCVCWSSQRMNEQDGTKPAES